MTNFIAQPQDAPSSGTLYARIGRASFGMAADVADGSSGIAVPRVTDAVVTSVKAAAVFKAQPVIADALTTASAATATARAAQRVSDAFTTAVRLVAAPSAVARSTDVLTTRSAIVAAVAAQLRLAAALATQTPLVSAILARGSALATLFVYEGSAKAGRIVPGKGTGDPTARWPFAPASANTMEPFGFDFYLELPMNDTMLGASLTFTCFVKSTSPVPDLLAASIIKTAYIVGTKAFALCAGFQPGVQYGLRAVVTTQRGAVLELMQFVLGKEPT
jgi:hypothetical protein